MKHIVVIGSGYVGTTTAAILANCNYSVTALDIDQHKVDLINQGKAPFFEEGLDSLIKHAVDNGHLSASSSYKSVANADIVFSCVGTPDNPDGSSNLAYVFAAAEEAAKYMKPKVLYIQKSTVPVGTGERIEKLFVSLSKQVRYVSNPEFLREGTAIADTLWFDRIVAGSSNKDWADEVLDIYRSVELCRNEVAKIASIKFTDGGKESYIATNRNSAELIKVTANAFLALKISFANSIAKLADRTGADINEVMDAVGADRRIGRAFLNAGRGYGGGCFPKDVTGLISSATEHGVELSIMTAASDLNESMPGYIANKVVESIGSLKDKRIAILGLAFKENTSDSRKSPGVKLANILSHDEARVSVYDPQANGEAREDLRKSVTICSSASKAIKNADVVCVATGWSEFINLDLKQLRSLMSGKLFVDAVNGFDSSKVKKEGLEYIGVGRN